MTRNNDSNDDSIDYESTKIAFEVAEELLEDDNWEGDTTAEEGVAALFEEGGAIEQELEGGVGPSHDLSDIDEVVTGQQSVSGNFLESVLDDTDMEVDAFFNYRSEDRFNPDENDDINGWDEAQREAMRSRNMATFQDDSNDYIGVFALTHAGEVSDRGSTDEPMSDSLALVADATQKGISTAALINADRHGADADALYNDESDAEAEAEAEAAA